MNFPDFKIIPTTVTTHSIIFRDLEVYNSCKQFQKMKTTNEIWQTTQPLSTPNCTPSHNFYI
jgi:hypothetical protein